MPDIHWSLKRFDELSPFEVYEILKLRSRVFVVEQDCVFLDMDDKDQLCHHYMGWKNGRLLAYTRIVPPGISYDEPSVGRVVNAPEARGAGIGRMLMARSIDQVYLLYGRIPIRIGAQLYLKHFYESLGFQQDGEIYDEDGIDHIHMNLS